MNTIKQCEIKQNDNRRIQFRITLNMIKQKIIELTNNQIEYKKMYKCKDTYNALEITAYLNFYWLFKGRDKANLPHVYKHDVSNQYYMLHKVKKLADEYGIEINI